MRVPVPLDRPRVAHGEWRWIAFCFAVGFGALLGYELWPFNETLIRLVVPPHGEARVSKSPDVAQLAVDSGLEGPVTAERAPATSGALTLVDTAPGQNAHEGTARLGSDTRNPQTFAAGALLANGARLSEIYADHVVVERNGRSAQLYVLGHGGPMSAAAKQVLEGNEPRSDQTNTARSTSESITEYLRPNPVFEGDRLRGLELYPGQRVGLFSSSGLRSGDVLVELNGVPVVDADQALSLLETLTSGSVVQATVERGGKATNVALDGSTIVTAYQASSAMMSNLSP